MTPSLFSLGAGRAAAVLGLTLALAGCGNTPPAPDWQVSAKGSAERATEAWLSGDTKIEALEFGRAREALARTARPDLLARLALLRCASRVAALAMEPCEAFEALATDASPADQAYARYLAGKADAADAALLPPPHRALAGGAAAADLAGIDDPLSRLVAAGVLFRRGLATPQTLQIAVDTASERGWRRPLMAWLTLQWQRAEAAGATGEAAALQRRLTVLAR